MTVFITVTCPDCHSTDIVKHGLSGEGKQRYRCRNEECLRRTFLLDYSNEGSKRSVKKKIADMSVNGSGVRDTARVLKISTSTVIKELKKTKSTPRKLTKKLSRKRIQAKQNHVEIVPFKSEVDEMQSFVGKKNQINVGYGMESTTIQEKCWLMFWVQELMKCFSNSKNFLNHLELRSFIQMG